MNDLDLNFRPEDYFQNTEKKKLTIVSISFSDLMNLGEHLGVEINVIKKDGNFEYSISDNMDPKYGYTYTLRKKTSQKTLTNFEVINMIQKDLKNPDGKSNIIYEEWDYQYYEKEKINISVNSLIYPDLKEYFDRVIENYNKERHLEIEEDYKYDKIINDHINKSNIYEIVSSLKQKKFGSFGIQPLRQEVFNYVKNFFLKNGKLPSGQHKTGSYSIDFKSD